MPIERVLALRIGVVENHLLLAVRVAERRDGFRTNTIKSHSDRRRVEVAELRHLGTRRFALLRFYVGGDFASEPKHVADFAEHRFNFGLAAAIFGSAILSGHD
jgi:hypothetical protein